MQRKRLHIKEDFTPVGEVVSISDMNGQPIQVTDAKEDNKKLPDKLTVVIEATHTGINRNKVSYSYDKLERSTDSWLRDYEKPVLLNHDSWSDPLGRVKSSAFKQSQIDPQKHCIQLTLEITNKAAIERFLDGRYKTFSIGGYTDSAVCSVCGKDQMTDGWCGHSRGKKYDGKECYWHLGLMDYDEISVVNTPADVHAQAISVEVVDPNAKPEDGKAAGGTGNVTDSADDPAAIIDSLLGNKDSSEEGAEPTGTENPEATKDGADGEGESGKNEDGEKEPTAEPTAGEGQEDEVTILRNQITALEDKVTELNNTITSKDEMLLAKDGEIVTKDTEIATISAERDAVKQELQVANEESQGLVKQNVTLAKYAHKILCEKVAELQIAVGDKKIDEKDSLITEYATFTSKKLNDMVSELVKPEKIVQRAIVTSPGVISESDSDDSTTGTKTEVTLEDYARTMRDFLVNKRS